MGAAAPVLDYAGYWLECQNQSCGFPVRVPYSPPMVKKGRRELAGSPGFLFACPVCLKLRSYKRKNLHKVRFRSPDPYKAGKLILYSVHMACRSRRCACELVIFTVAAASVSIASMLQLWKAWKVELHCAPGHRFQIPDPASWWVQQERWLP